MSFNSYTHTLSLSLSRTHTHTHARSPSLLAQQGAREVASAYDCWTIFKVQTKSKYSPTAVMDSTKRTVQGVLTKASSLGARLEAQLAIAAKALQHAQAARHQASHHSELQEALNEIRQDRSAQHRGYSPLHLLLLLG
eukprot:m.130113 g.130113  ORF g.130113 m.130113 type:complete len:138 (+) comp13896_c2_seq10:89-502(+)